MNKLIVSGNKIIDEEGKEIILKGACLIDPALTLKRDNHFSLKDLKNIKELGFNTIKVVIVPSMFEAEKDYCKKFLDSIVKECKELSLYCWIDWHAQGNPLTNETRSPEILDGEFMRYDARKKVALKVWDILAKRYGSEEHVIFEIFANPLGPSWKEWKEVAKELIEKIREFSNNIISVSGVKWMSDISEVLLNPLKGKNIIYSVVIYPNYKVDKKVVAEVKKKYPVNIVECGFIEKTNDKVFEGSEKDYAIPFNKFLKETKIGFMAWVYHPFGLTSKASVLINSWNPEDLSAWGKFVKTKML